MRLRCRTVGNLQEVKEATEALFEHERQSQPAGLVVRRELISTAEETDLLGRLAELDLYAVVMRGQPSRRLVRHYGLRYDYASSRITEGEPAPQWLDPMRERCAGLAGVRKNELAQILVTQYPPGSGIGWHRDAAPFGIVVGVSLESACEMRFRRGSSGRTTFALGLAPRSAYLLAGDVRANWQHSIPAVQELRWSVTFRTLRRSGSNRS
jgi:alkylated DNA repair dioxygenase AlkB